MKLTIYLYLSIFILSSLSDEPDETEPNNKSIEPENNIEEGGEESQNSTSSIITETETTTTTTTTTEAPKIIPKITSKLVPVKMRKMVLVSFFDKTSRTIFEDINQCGVKIEVNIQDSIKKYNFLTDGHIGRVDIVLNDEYEENKLFVDNLKLKIKITNQHFQDSNMAEREFSVHVSPNGKMEIGPIFSERFRYYFTVATMCDRSYIGVNCNEETPTSEEISEDKLTPFKCSDNSTTCFESVICTYEENICLNDAKCYKSPLDKNIKYCVCPPGFGGYRCQNTEAPYTDFDILFGAKYEQPQLIDGSCEHCPNKACKKVGSFDICTESFGNKFLCIQDCRRVCGHEYCANYKELTTLYYMKSLKMDEAVPEPSTTQSTLPPPTEDTDDEDEDNGAESTGDSVPSDTQNGSSSEGLPNAEQSVISNPESVQVIAEPVVAGSV